MQTILEKYAHLVSEVNKHVSDFNEFLAPQHRLRFIDARDSRTFSVIADTPRDSQSWPSSGYAGMYVFGAYDEQNPSRLGAYIGKASLRNMGNRIWARLNPGRGTETYTMQSGPDIFRIEVIMAVPITSPTMRSMACALEEHVIKHGLEDIYLLNAIGTRPIA